MASAPIGIDLGTTYTVAAIFRNDNPEIIPNTDGNRLTSSLVYYGPEDLEVLIGEIAKDRSKHCPRNFIRDIKRIIGRKFSDAHVQNYMARGNKIFGLQMTCGLNGNVNIILECNNTDAGAEATKTPEDVSSEVLKYIKESAENSGWLQESENRIGAFCKFCKAELRAHKNDLTKHSKTKLHIINQKRNEYVPSRNQSELTALGIKTTEAVISVPAYFSYAQRAATKRAAEKVGLKVLGLITEPVAAAIYYTRGHEEDMQLLMVDLGGGTLDVSIIKCTKDKFEVKSIEGDLFLGGSDFDWLIFDYLRKKIGESYGSDFIDSDSKKGARFLQRLKNYAVRTKHALSRQESYTNSIEVPNGDIYDILITREQFEELSTLLFQRVSNKVQKCLTAASLIPSNIDKVVLVGGSTRIPKLKELLADMFGENKLFTDLNPDEAVALGASIHAALLKNDLAGFERYQIKDVAPHSLGISTHYDLTIKFIEKGVALPATTTQHMLTSFNDQKSILFKVCEGERKRYTHNKEIGILEICNLPPGRAGQVRFEVTFYLDENGELHVTASEQSTGNTKQLEIKMNNLLLCDSDIFVSPQHEQEIVEEDETWEQFYRFRISTDQYCHNIMYDVDRPILNSKKDDLIKTLNIFKTRCELLNFRIIDILKDEFEKLKTNVQLVLGEN